MQQNSIKINIAPQIAERKLIVTYKGNSLPLPYVVWQSLGQRSTEDVFGLTNRYIAEHFSEEDNEVVFDAITKLTRALMHHDLLGEGVIVIRELVTTIAKVMDIDRCISWCKGRIYIDPSIPTEKSGINPHDMTYTRAEVEELSGYCIALRILTPVLGLAIHLVDKIVGSQMKEANTLNFIMCTPFGDHPVLERLSRYTDRLSEERKKQTNTPLTHGIATVELGAWMLGLAVCRKLLVSELNNTPESSPLISHIFTSLDDRVKTLAGSNYRDKISVGGRGDSEQDGFADQWRRPTSETITDSSLESYYLEDIYLLVRDLKFTSLETNNAVRIAEMLTSNRHFFTHIAHVPIIALVMGDIVTPKLLGDATVTGFINAIAVTTSWLQSHGFEDIAKMMVAIRHVRKVDEMAMGNVGGVSFRRLPSALVAQLDAIYIHRPLKNSVNPGIVTIEEIIKFFLTDTWVGMEYGMDDLRASIAKLIIERPIEKRIIAELEAEKLR